MPFFIDVFHGFYRTAIVPTFIDIVPFLINIVPTNNLFLSFNPIQGEKEQTKFVQVAIQKEWVLFAEKFTGSPQSTR